MCVAVDGLENVQIIRIAELGTTDTLIGTFRVLASLKVLAGWMVET